MPTEHRRFCAVQAFCGAKPWRRGDSLTPSIIKMGSHEMLAFYGRGIEDAADIIADIEKALAGV